MGKRMPPGTSLYSRLDAVVERQGLCVAIIAENQNITYLALRTAIDNCAATLAARGLRRGQSVAVSFTRPELYPITLFAASKIGVSLVFAGFDDATNVTPKPDRLLTDDRMPIAQRKGALVMDQTWFAPRPSGPASRLAKTGNVVFVFGTSGSSGRRKFVRIGEANLINRLSSYEIYIDGDTRLMCTIGMGLLASTETCLTTLLFGGSIVMPPGNRQSLAHYIDLFQVNALQ
ncbi:MAG: hypothetical protein OEU92_35340, partial [Alphaproteobacteria bacterium]|nr:hypothetical protein [Alphaproteobacteria bacterium]